MNFILRNLLRAKLRMSESDQHWRNVIKTFQFIQLTVLEKELNDFFKDRFVIATQIFPRKEASKIVYDVVVYYKVPPEAKE